MARRLILFLFGWCISFQIWAQPVDQWINLYRTDLGLTPLFIEPSLQRTAENYLDELIQRGALSHESLEGESLMDRYRRFQGTGWVVGEILGTQNSQEDPRRLLELWRESPDHKSVLEGEQWSAMGWAIRNTGDSWVAVVLFSNSIVERIEDRRLYFFPFTGNLHLQSYPEGEVWTWSNPVLPLDQLDITGFQLIEIQDREGRLRNRFFTH